MRSVIEKTQSLLNQMSYCRAVLSGKGDDEDDREDLDDRYAQ